MTVRLQFADLLLVVDMQNDFIGGALAVRGADRVVAAVSCYVREFRARGLPVIATRDWHPIDHCSFRDRGGPWPAHCVQGLEGAAFPAQVALGPDVQVVSKGVHADRDAYSGFDGTALDRILRAQGASRLFACGLATDYCVRATVIDALRLGYRVFVLADAIAAVDAREGDGRRALEEMRLAGAVTIAHADIDSAKVAHG